MTRTRSPEHQNERKRDIQHGAVKSSRPFEKAVIELEHVEKASSENNPDPSLTWTQKKPRWQGKITTKTMSI